MSRVAEREARFQAALARPTRAVQCAPSFAQQTGWTARYTDPLCQDYVLFATVTEYDYPFPATIEDALSSPLLKHYLSRAGADLTSSDYHGGVRNQEQWGYMVEAYSPASSDNGAVARITRGALQYYWERMKEEADHAE